MTLFHGKKVGRCAIVSAATVRTGVSNGLHLVHVKVVNDGIKTGVEVVQQIHHLEGGAAPSNLCEPNNVTGRGEGKEVSCIDIHMYSQLTSISLYLK